MASRREESMGSPLALENIDRTLSEMSLQEKIGQMTQVSNECISHDQVVEYAIGSVLSGGDGNPQPNTAESWATMVGDFVAASTETRLKIPLVYGVDAVHGHSNVGGATIFPHNIGLGAVGDPDLVERIGEATAAEMMATGVLWAFAPTVAVPQDIRWGRTYEGFSSDHRVVSDLSAALIEGLHGDHDGGTIDVMACAKHYVADGAAAWGSTKKAEWVDWWDGWGETWRIDQGDARISEEELRRVHLAPYRAAVDAGVSSVMASYSSWHGDKMHGHRRLLTDVLKGELGFGGFVISDWMGIDQLAPDYTDCVVLAVNSGVDMVMVPEDFLRFIDAVEQAVVEGRIPIARIDDAVRRILTAKAAVNDLGLEGQRPSLSEVGSAAHRSLAAEAVRRSAVLLKDDGVLPVVRGQHEVYVAGQAANDIGLQCGGWTVGWQGGTGPTTQGSTLLDGLRSVFGESVTYSPNGDFGSAKQVGLAVVAVAEPPYAEGPGDCGEPRPRDEDLAAFHKARHRAERVILVVYSGRPLVIPELIEQSDAVVAAWLPGTEASVVAELIAGKWPFEGQSPHLWPDSKSDLPSPMGR